VNINCINCLLTLFVWCLRWLASQIACEKYSRQGYPLIKDIKLHNPTRCHHTRPPMMKMEEKKSDVKRNAFLCGQGKWIYNDQLCVEGYGSIARSTRFKFIIFCDYCLSFLIIALFCALLAMLICVFHKQACLTRISLIK